MPEPKPQRDARDLAVAACAGFATSSGASNAVDRYDADPGRAAALSGAVRDSRLAAERDPQWSDLAVAIEDAREAALNGDSGAQLGSLERAWSLCSGGGQPLYVAPRSSPSSPG